MSAPDVIDQAGALYDATAAGWSPTRDVHPLGGICGPELQAPVHAKGCFYADFPRIAVVCPCQPA